MPLAGTIPLLGKTPFYCASTGHLGSQAGSGSRVGFTTTVEQSTQMTLLFFLYGILWSLRERRGMSLVTFHTSDEICTYLNASEFGAAIPESYSTVFCDCVGQRERLQLPDEFQLLFITPTMDGTAKRNDGTCLPRPLPVPGPFHQGSSSSPADVHGGWRRLLCRCRGLVADFILSGSAPLLLYSRLGHLPPRHLSTANLHSAFLPPLVDAFVTRRNEMRLLQSAAHKNPERRIADELFLF